MSSINEVVIVSGARTAIGTFNGSLASVAPTQLGAAIVREAIPGGQLWLTPGAHNPEHVDTLLAELTRAR